MQRLVEMAYRKRMVIVYIFEIHYLELMDYSFLNFFAHKIHTYFPSVIKKNSAIPSRTHRNPLLVF